MEHTEGKCTVPDSQIGEQTTREKTWKGGKVNVRVRVPVRIEQSERESEIGYLD